MARASGGRGTGNFSPFPKENPESTGQLLLMLTEPKGVDRFHESSRVDPQHVVKIRNFMLEDGVLISRLGTDLMGGEAASPVVQVIDFVRQGLNKVTIRFCTRHIEIFDYGSGTWQSIVVPLTGSEEDFFAYTGWADKLLFSNGVDGLWEFDFRTLSAKLVPEGPSCKHLATFGLRVIATNTLEEGGNHTYRVRWSANRDYTKWAESTEESPLLTSEVGGYEDLFGSAGGLPDEVEAVVPYSDTQAWLIRSRSVYLMSVTGNVLAPFRFDVVLDRIGSPHRQSIASMPGGVIFAGWENIFVLSTSGGLDIIGDMVIDEITEEAEDLRNAFGTYDVGRNEYRIAFDKLVWRYRFQEKGWTTDEYPWQVKALGRQLQGVAGIPIDSLVGTIDELTINYPPGRIDDLVLDRQFDNSMMFVPWSSALTMRETDDPRDVLTNGIETPSEILLETGVVTLDATGAVELHDVILEYISEMTQYWMLEVSFNDGAFWLPFSVKTIEDTSGSEVLFFKNERVSRKIRLRLRSPELGKFRLLGMVPTLVRVQRTNMANNRPKPASITILPNPISLSVGGTQQLSVMVLDANGQPITNQRVSLFSSNNTIATVSASGVVRGIAAGPFAIVASVRNIQRSVQGNVNALAPTPVATITISPSIAEGAAGSQQQYTATLRDSNGNVLLGRTVVWSSSAPTFATISSSGLATLLSAGTTVISATSEGVTSGVTLTVTAAADVVVTVEVTPATFALDTGQTVQLVAIPKDSGGNALVGKVITWASDALVVATVNATGLVTAVGAGNVTITATCETIEGDSTGVITAADVPVATVTVAPPSFSIAEGATQALVATLRDASNNILTGRVVTWASNNNAVAVVSSSGLVTAVAAGSATITATSEGKSGTSGATITAPAVATVTISPSSFSVNVGETRQLTATLRDASNNILTGRPISWGSSDVTKATVSSTGLVTAVASGSVVITATSETKSGTSNGTVGTATYSSVDSTSEEVYNPEPNPAGAPATLPERFLDSRNGYRSDGTAVGIFASTVTLTTSGVAAQDTSALQAALNEAGSRAGNSRIILGDGFHWEYVQCPAHTAGDYYTQVEAQNLPSAEFVEADPALMTNSPRGTTTVFGCALQFNRSARGYRFMGLVFDGVPKTSLSVVYHLVLVSARESSIDYFDPAFGVSDITFDRCYFRGNDFGTGTDTGNVRDGILNNGEDVSVVDCVFEGIGATGTESHAVLQYNSKGGFKWVGGRAEATSIICLIGGAAPEFGPTEGRPRDIEIRRVYFHRRLEWANTDPSWDGVTGRGIKNWLEFKNTDRALVEGCVFDSNWADGQSGMGIVIKSANGNPGGAAGMGSENITLRHNITKNSPRCWNPGALPDEQDAIPANRVVIYNNLSFDIGDFAGQTQPGMLWLFLQSFHDLWVVNNTAITNNTPHAMQLAYPRFPDPAGAKRFVFRNNLTQMAYVWSDNGTGTAAIEDWTDSDYVWEYNGLIMDSGNWGIHPGGTNLFVATQAAVQFVNLAGDDYHLAGGSPFKNQGPGGIDIGADIDKINLATSGVGL